jgi:hypothetical protein
MDHRKIAVRVPVMNEVQFGRVVRRASRRNSENSKANNRNQ